MLKDALEFIFARSDASANAVAKLREIGPRKRVVTLNGSEIVEEIEPSPLVRRAETLAAVAALSERFGVDDVTAFVSESGVVVVLDDSDRIETVEMAFELSEQFKCLLQLASGLDQKRLVRTLRTTLAGAIPNEDFLRIVRQVEFDVARGTRSEVSHQKETLGRSVEKQVRANAGEVPETLRVVVPLFSVPHDLPTEISLECAVSVDMDSEKIAIEPTGDSLLREKKRIMHEIVDRLNVAMPADSLVVEGSVLASARGCWK